MTLIAGRYELLRELGQGGMATVHLARQAELDRLVALKELSSLPAGDTSAERFLREARFAGSLSHPSIVTVHDFFLADGTPYIAMEFVPGGTLRRYQRTITHAQTYALLLDVLAGLGQAERLGIVHRDLKPENLLVTADGRVKIADFGIAKAVDRARGATRLTATGTTIGTPDYIAPEQALGGEIGPWSDLYSLGCIAFELLAGRPPFAEAESAMAVLLAHVNETVPPVRRFDASVEPAVADWVADMVAKEAGDRIPSAPEAAAALEDVVYDTLGPRWRSSALLVPVLDDAEARPPATRAGMSLATTLPPTLPREPTGAVAAAEGGGRSWPRAASVRRGARLMRWTIALAVACAVILGRVLSGGAGAPPASPDGRVAEDSAADPAAAGGRAAQGSQESSAATGGSRSSSPSGARAAATPRPASTPTSPRRATSPAPTATAAPVSGGTDPAISTGGPSAAPTAQPPETFRPAPQPAATRAPARSCAGDSVSDDPSDDECEDGEP